MGINCSSNALGVAGAGCNNIPRNIRKGDLGRASLQAGGRERGYGQGRWINEGEVQGLPLQRASTAAAFAADILTFCCLLNRSLQFDHWYWGPQCFCKYSLHRREKSSVNSACPCKRVGDGDCAACMSCPVTQRALQRICFACIGMYNYYLLTVIYAAYKTLCSWLEQEEMIRREPNRTVRRFSPLYNAFGVSPPQSCTK